MATIYGWVVDKQTKKILVAWCGESFWFPSTPMNAYRNNDDVVIYLKHGPERAKFWFRGWHSLDTPIEVPKEILMKELMGAIEWQPST